MSTGSYDWLHIANGPRSVFTSRGGDDGQLEKKKKIGWWQRTDARQLILTDAGILHLPAVIVCAGLTPSEPFPKNDGLMIKLHALEMPNRPKVV